ncbi:MAG TPA: VOC family protein [Thermoanaerobaculia bacterium]|nr:VOC family protein [Thermoanaerobaculia bacterium]
MQFIPYLNFDGQCEEAFRFYERCLGGKLEITTHGDSPIAEHVPPEWHQRIMHARLTVGDAVLMASDSQPGEHVNPQGMYVALQIDDPAEAERIFQALAENGTVLMALEETFWADRFGMLVDRFGIQWMINCGMRGGNP